jgi:hypothetical protein
MKRKWTLGWEHIVYAILLILFFAVMASFGWFD